MVEGAIFDDSLLAVWLNAGDARVASVLWCEEDNAADSNTLFSQMELLVVMCCVFGVGKPA